MAYRDKTEDNNRIKFIDRLLLRVIKILDNQLFISKLEISITKTIYGFLSISEIPYQRDFLSEIYILVYYLRILGGLDLELIKDKEGFYLINVNNLYEKSPYGMQSKNRKFLIADALTKFQLKPDEKDAEFSSLKSSVSDLNNLVILTHNRPDLLKNCLESYISNIVKFSDNNLNIIVSDDSEPEISLKNRQVIDSFRLKYPNIMHLDYQFRNTYILNLKKKINNQNYAKMIDYIFGISFPSSFGRNRNFISLYMSSRAFVSVDDDSLPFLKTYKLPVIRAAIDLMLNNNDYQLKNLFLYIPVDAETELNEIDFIGYFLSFDQNIMQYTRYSGVRDLNLYFHVLRNFGLNLERIGAFELFNSEDLNKNKRFLREFPEITFTYGIKENIKPRLHGLCSYFPSGCSKFRLTISENLRMEDLFLGANYWLESGSVPIETNFAIFHNKTHSAYISARAIHQEIISIVIYNLYLEILLKLSGTDQEKISSLYHAFQQQKIIIPDNSLKFIEKHKLQVLNLFNNGLKLTTDKNVAEKISIYIKDIENEFYSHKNEYYLNFISNYINYHLKTYIETLAFWSFIILPFID